MLNVGKERCKKSKKKVSMEITKSPSFVILCSVPSLPPQMIIFVLTLCIRTYFSQSIKRCVSSFGRRPNEKKKSAVLISSANNSLNMNGNFYLHALEKKLINFCIFAISSFSTRHVNTFLIKAGDLIFNLFYFPPLLKAQH